MKQRHKNANQPVQKGYAKPRQIVSDQQEFELAIYMKYSLQIR
jgi:hypothetical protein